MVDAILDGFASDGTLGLVFPEDPHLSDWNENRPIAEDLARRIGITGALPTHFDFPNGTMFWARPAALQPLFSLGLKWEDYPPEPLPYDGTILHALERLLPFAAAKAGFRYATTFVPGSTR
jgi:lipopolysaccharide biosynthesis protein